ncbi:hypothetical protein [uncultured Gammaproteobacteria bacterium]|jgi:hypothetical protein|nr:hypothetical protein [uncultured Gammaproteobacteria bacterium]
MLSDWFSAASKSATNTGVIFQQEQGQIIGDYYTQHWQGQFFFGKIIINQTMVYTFFENMDS